MESRKTVFQLPRKRVVKSRPSFYELAGEIESILGGLDERVNGGGNASLGVPLSGSGKTKD